jgi:hypothetical protein
MNAEISLARAAEMAVEWHKLLEREGPGTLEGHEDAIFAMTEALARSVRDLKFLTAFLDCLSWAPELGVTHDYLQSAKEAAARLRGPR